MSEIEKAREDSERKSPQEIFTASYSKEEVKKLQGLWENFLNSFEEEEDEV